MSVAAQASSPCWLRYVSNALVVALPDTGVVIENGDYNDEVPKCETALLSDDLKFVEAVRQAKEVRPGWSSFDLRPFSPRSAAIA